MAARIKAGAVWVNTYRAVSFLMLFGGYKASGIGRENGAEAIDGYLQSKSVWINNGPGGGNPFIMRPHENLRFWNALLRQPTRHDANCLNRGLLTRRSIDEHYSGVVVFQHLGRSVVACQRDLLGI